MCLEVEEVISPNAILRRMLNFVKLLMILNFLIALLRLATNEPFNCIYDLICVFLLYISHNSIFFMYMGIYIFFSIFNCFMILISFGLILQKLVIVNSLSLSDYFSLSILLFMFFFYIISVCFIFPIYIEMKAQMFEINNGNLELQNQCI